MDVVAKNCVCDKIECLAENFDKCPNCKLALCEVHLSSDAHDCSQVQGKKVLKRDAGGASPAGGAVVEAADAGQSKRAVQVCTPSRAGERCQ